MAEQNVTVRMDSDEVERIRELWKRAGFKSLQEAGQHALRTAFLQGPDSQVPAKYRPYLKKLEEILSSGDEAIIRAVVSNIEVFHDRMRPADDRKER